MKKILLALILLVSIPTFAYAEYYQVNVNYKVETKTTQRGKTTRTTENYSVSYQVEANNKLAAKEKAKRRFRQEYPSPGDIYDPDDPYTSRTITITVTSSEIVWQAGF